MKSFVLAAVAIAAATASVWAVADPASNLTRSQVKAEQAQYERAGYSPRDWIHYPDSVQAAGRKVARERSEVTNAQP